MFPGSDENGSPTNNINPSYMQMRRAGNPLLETEELAQRTSAHAQFLDSGGAGGRWQTLLFPGGLVFGFYTGAKGDVGEQANFEFRAFEPNLDLSRMRLPFANFASCEAKKTKFSRSDLSFSLFTDAILDRTDFSGANLEGTDFSRASLRYASFQQANLRGADFENCDLTNADFTGANTEEARFNGAKLTGVVKLH